MISCLIPLTPDPTFFPITLTLDPSWPHPIQELRQDALKEQQLLKKLSPEERAQSQSILASSLQFGLAIEFERSNCLRRFRLFLSEILKVMGQLDSLGQFRLIQSDLFECEAHLEEISDIMCVAVAGRRSFRGWLRA